MRTVTSGVAVLVTVPALPGLSFPDWWRGRFLIAVLVFGLLTALAKPTLEFVSLRYLALSYRPLLFVVNVVALGLISGPPDRLIGARDPLTVLLGGAVTGVIGMFLDTIAGAPPPAWHR